MVSPAKPLMSLPVAESPDPTAAAMDNVLHSSSSRTGSDPGPGPARHPGPLPPTCKIQEAIVDVTSSSSDSPPTSVSPPSHLTTPQDSDTYLMRERERKPTPRLQCLSATSRRLCNSASDVNIRAWFSFNGFNNKKTNGPKHERLGSC